MVWAIRVIMPTVTSAFPKGAKTWVMQGLLCCSLNVIRHERVVRISAVSAPYRTLPTRWQERQTRALPLAGKGVIE